MTRQREFTRPAARGSRRHPTPGPVQAVRAAPWPRSLSLDLTPGSTFSPFTESVSSFVPGLTVV